jgi:coiled-coil domain-containing protein 130
MAAEKKAILQKRLTGNTRAAVDPFLREEHIWQPRVKRKRAEPAISKPSEPVVRRAALVSYDSDSS